mmetsp:Transcript_20920/g.62418  ORF Transcript_20920/g.62418 Transcript_20920/m.62418 type:complete len:329 (+) Transcript_20920:328-1314(+)
MAACVSMDVEVPGRGPPGLGAVRPSITIPAVKPISFNPEALPGAPRHNLPSPSAVEAATALTAWSVGAEGAGQPPMDEYEDEDEAPLPPMVQPAAPALHATRSGGAPFVRAPRYDHRSAGDSPTLQSDLHKVLEDAQPVAQFVRTLHRLAEGPFAETLCQWSESGRRIVFPDPELFGETVCPQFFRHSKWTSFSRMLNMYEFRKVSSSQRNAQNQSLALDETCRRRPLPMVFEHPHFNRENPQLHLIVRRKRKKARGAPGAEAKPTVHAEAQYQALREPISELEDRLHGLERENSDLAGRNKQLEGRLRELELENAFLRSRDLDLHLP